MSFEKPNTANKNEEQDRVQEEIQAVQEGRAWPTKEGLKDPEIKAAFKDYFNSMSEEDVEHFADVLDDIEDDIEAGLANKSMGYVNPRSIAATALMGVAGIAAITERIYGIPQTGTALLVPIFQCFATYAALQGRSENRKKQESLIRADETLKRINQLFNNWTE